VSKSIIVQGPQSPVPIVCTVTFSLGYYNEITCFSSPAGTKFFPAARGLIIFIFAHDWHCIAKFGAAWLLAHHLLH